MFQNEHKSFQMYILGIYGYYKDDKYAYSSYYVWFC